MELRFGLNNHLEKTQKEVADMLGISQSYISRLEKRILGRLKREIVRMLQPCGRQRKQIFLSDLNVPGFMDRDRRKA